VLAPLIALIVFLGVYPKPVLDRIAPSVAALIQHVEDQTDYVEPEVSRTHVDAEGDDGDHAGDEAEEDHG